MFFELAVGLILLVTSLGAYLWHASLGTARQALTQLGLRLEGRSASGVVGGTAFRIQLVPGDNRMSTIRAFEVETADPLNIELTLGPEGAFQALADATGATDLVLGERRFDEAVRLTAPDVTVAYAILDPATRDAVSAAIAAGARFEGGRLRGTVPGKRGRTAEGLRTLLDPMALAHRRLREAASRPIRERAAERVTNDRSAKVRRGALTTLVERDQASPPLLRMASSDPDAGVRFAAGVALGDEGEDVLLKLAHTGSRTWRTRAAVELAGRSSAPEHQPVLEDALLAVLDDGELGTLAAEALGSVGTARSLPALQGVGGAARRAARASHTAIQERLGLQGGGQLSLGEDVGGGLALADEAGALSEPPSSE